MCECSLTTMFETCWGWDSCCWLVPKFFHHLHWHQNRALVTLTLLLFPMEAMSRGPNLKPLNFHSLVAWFYQRFKFSLANPCFDLDWCLFRLWIHVGIVRPPGTLVEFQGKPSGPENVRHKPWTTMDHGPQSAYTVNNHGVMFVFLFFLAGHWSWSKIARKSSIYFSLARYVAMFPFFPWSSHYFTYVPNIVPHVPTSFKMFCHRIPKLVMFPRFSKISPGFVPQIYIDIVACRTTRNWLRCSPTPRRRRRRPLVEFDPCFGGIRTMLSPIGLWAFNHET